MARSIASRTARPTEYFAPKARYIWSLAVAPDGALYVGTGDQGKIFRVEGAGKGEVYYDTGQSHITGLAVDSQGRLLAGTEPNGILYRITAKDKAFVLYDSPPAGDPRHRSHARWHGVRRGAGRVRRQARAGRRSRPPRATSGSGPPIASPPPSPWKPRPGGEIKPPDAKPAAQPPAPPPLTQVTTQFTPAVDVSGVEKSAVYRINPDNTVETLWSSKEENVYDLLALEKQILFSTDQNGRIYGLSPDRRVTLVTADQRRRNHAPAACRALRAGRHRQHGPHLSAWAKARRQRLLRSAGARFRHRLAMGQPQLARRNAGRLQHWPFAPAPATPPSPTAPGANGPSPLTDSAGSPHHQPQRALHPVEGRDDRHRRRDTRS